jgi:hypothetical protein
VVDLGIERGVDRVYMLPRIDGDACQFRVNRVDLVGHCVRCGNLGLHRFGLLDRQGTRRILFRGLGTSTIPKGELLGGRLNVSSPGRERSVELTVALLLKYSI